MSPPVQQTEEQYKQSEKEEDDSDEFEPEIVKIAFVQVILGLVASLNLEIEQIDVKKIILHGTLKFVHHWSTAYGATSSPPGTAAMATVWRPSPAAAIRRSRSGKTTATLSSSRSDEFGMTPKISSSPWQQQLCFHLPRRCPQGLIQAVQSTEDEARIPSPTRPQTILPASPPSTLTATSTSGHQQRKSTASTGRSSSSSKNPSFQATTMQAAMEEIDGSSVIFLPSDSGHATTHQKKRAVVVDSFIPFKIRPLHTGLERKRRPKNEDGRQEQVAAVRIQRVSNKEGEARWWQRIIRPGRPLLSRLAHYWPGGPIVIHVAH
ncbi:hypothetical protein ACLOJK_028489 [Asimina triloba]